MTISAFYHIPENAYNQLHTVRDSLRLLTYSAEDDQGPDRQQSQLMASFLRLMDQEISAVISGAEFVAQPARRPLRRV